MFKRRGQRVPLDLKFHDIPHQVQGAALGSNQRGRYAHHAHRERHRHDGSGSAHGAEEGAAEYGGTCRRPRHHTVLTSAMSPEALAGHGRRPAPARAGGGPRGPPRRRASPAWWLCPGGGCLARIWGPTPSSSLPACARPAPGPRDQSRVATPAQAFANGASHRGGPAHHRGA